MEQQKGTTVELKSPSSLMSSFFALLIIIALIASMFLLVPFAESRFQGYFIFLSEEPALWLFLGIVLTAVFFASGMTLSSSWLSYLSFFLSGVVMFNIAFSAVVGSDVYRKEVAKYKSEVIADIGKEYHLNTDGIDGLSCVAGEWNYRIGGTWQRYIPTVSCQKNRGFAARFNEKWPYSKSSSPYAQ
ncbi:hypothetical protein EI16_12175 [Hydrogenovibrio marinus]|uniref:Uncharacterized protein n=2 Tax=Hydrogenovibrio marinus TaxID=28885 RepID=A0A066ZQW0_HYDMR|nr:hypothetical protein [Hydrogenovibrio marinus]KDN94649.1 hypothetical protein EI16_12175 [Hydrogenovibrio marinus]